MNGVLVINKEKDYTSRDVVNKLNKILNTKRIGHTGTLDPLATGVLVICINRYTKLVNLLTALNKEYIATMKFGYETDTLDVTGKTIKECDYIPDLNEVKSVLNSFFGKSMQEVPLYSAKKVRGKKLYDYARSNEFVELPKQEIEIYQIEVLSYLNGILKFKVNVKKGTYIRSLIRDIAHKLNTCAVMVDLERTKQGNFSISDSYTLDDVEKGKYTLKNLQDIFSFPRIDLADKELKIAKNGGNLRKKVKDGYVILYYKGKELAIFNAKDNILKPYIMIDNNI